MLKRLFLRLKGFIGRVTEVTGVVLALFAAYEMAIADRIAPHVIGNVWLCEEPRHEGDMTRDAFFAFLRENADSVVYLDFWVSPVARTGEQPDPTCMDNGQVQQTAKIRNGLGKALIVNDCCGDTDAAYQTDMHVLLGVFGARPLAQADAGGAFGQFLVKAALIEFCHNLALQLIALV